jgi:predicted nucleic acid-binding protein
MTGVFLDTVGLLAVWDTSDQWHVPAAEAYRNLLHRGCPLLATNAVLLECGNAAARRPYRQRVKALREALLEEHLLVEPTVEEVAAAWEAFDRREAGQAGIVDHLSFAVMRRLGLTEAFTNDRHFQAAGFLTLF